MSEADPHGIVVDELMRQLDGLAKSLGLSEAATRLIVVRAIADF